MNELYPSIKAAHLGFVTCSAILFAVRGGAVLANCRWPMKKPWRMLSYIVDTGLLATGLVLAATLAIDPIDSSWFRVKLLLIPAYIVLGSYGLKRATTFEGRLRAYIGAVCLLLFIVSVALAHHPLGVLHSVLR